MTTIWKMPDETIIERRDALKREVAVHEESTITQFGAWESIKAGYQLMIDRYNDELKKRVDDPTRIDRDQTF